VRRRAVLSAKSRHVAAALRLRAHVLPRYTLATYFFVDVTLRRRPMMPPAFQGRPLADLPPRFGRACASATSFRGREAPEAFSYLRSRKALFAFCAAATRYVIRHGSSRHRPMSPPFLVAICRPPAPSLCLSRRQQLLCFSPRICFIMFSPCALSTLAALARAHMLSYVYACRLFSPHAL